MKTNLKKLTALLCEVDEVKKDIMELRFWCKVYYNWEYRIIYDYKNIAWKIFINIGRWLSEEYKDNYWIKEIIWNPIEYHHLMMYCESKWIKLSINNYNTTQSGIFFNWNGCCVLDNSKPLNQQSAETLWKIYNFLKW